METKSNEIYEIPSVPTNNPNLNDKTGLKNLAGWIARYCNLGLRLDESSDFVQGLLENGTLAKFEPSLVGVTACCSYEENGIDEFEHYEFSFLIENFVCVEGHNGCWANLHFYFRAKECSMLTTWCDQSEKNDNISSALKTMFGAIGVESLEKDETKRITWQEADEIICSYLRYIHNPVIPSLLE